MKLSIFYPGEKRQLSKAYSNGYNQQSIIERVHAKWKPVNKPTTNTTDYRYSSIDAMQQSAYRNRRSSGDRLRTVKRRERDRAAQCGSASTQTSESEFIPFDQQSIYDQLDHMLLNDTNSCNAKIAGILNEPSTPKVIKDDIDPFKVLVIDVQGRGRFTIAVQWWSCHLSNMNSTPTRHIDFTQENVQECEIPRYQLALHASNSALVVFQYDAAEDLSSLQDLKKFHGEYIASVPPAAQQRLVICKKEHLETHEVSTEQARAIIDDPLALYFETYSPPGEKLDEQMRTILQIASKSLQSNALQERKAVSFDRGTKSQGDSFEFLDLLLDTPKVNEKSHGGLGQTQIPGVSRSLTRHAAYASRPNTGQVNWTSQNEKSKSQSNRLSQRIFRNRCSLPYN